MSYIIIIIIIIIMVLKPWKKKNTKTRRVYVDVVDDVSRFRVGLNYTYYTKDIP